MLVRKMVTNIDWDCEIKTLFREKNLGCKIAVGSAIDWFFKHVEEGIILEDDVVPQNAFFYFCQQGLDVWRSNNSIGGIGGFVPNSNSKPYLSIHGSIWGWATWKRAWCNYDQFKLINKKDFDFLSKISSLPTLCEKKNINENLKKMELDTWDYYWMFSRIAKKQFVILPGAPLTKNIGFATDEGTHIKGSKPKALADADKIQITKKSIDHLAVSKKQSSTIRADYSRIYSRYSHKILFVIFKSFISFPFFSLFFFLDIYKYN